MHDLACRLLKHGSDTSTYIEALPLGYRNKNGVVHSIMQPLLLFKWNNQERHCFIVYVYIPCR